MIASRALRDRLQQGLVIPAHPLALDAGRKLDARHQRALTRYYVDAGAGGIAVGVHTTQFAIRDPAVGLFEPVLRLAAATADAQAARRGRRVMKVAGICGRTPQALREAALAVDLGYDAGLLSFAAFRDDDISAVVAHAGEVARVLPVFGFYLQPAVGGRRLPFEFWRRLADIENVVAIKMAPFNRYQTLDVVRAVCEAGRQDQIALYTGNDDNIVLDLLTEYRFAAAGGVRSARIVGGLLGHWAVWTSRAAALLGEWQACARSGAPLPPALLTQAVAVTDMNAALFDVANGFAGCIAGVHEVLRRQGLMAGTWCLDPHEALSPGQAAELDRVCRAYPDLTDDAFVRAHLSEWLEP